MQSNNVPANLFKDPSEPVRGCSCCGETLWHDSTCWFTEVCARPDPPARTWRQWIVPTPVLSHQLKEETNESQ